jgi:hypothetical protein
MIVQSVAAAALAVPLAVTPAPTCWDSAWRCRTLLEVRGGNLDQTGWLQAAAKAWSEQMAAEGRIYHAPVGDYSPYGENVGTGPDWPTVLAAFIDSPPHLANIRDPDYRQVGIGVVRSGGRIYVTIRFH